MHGFLLFWFLYIYLQSTLLSPQHTTWPYGRDWVQMVLIPYTCTLNFVCFRLHLSKKVSLSWCGLMNRLLEDESDNSVNITSNTSKIKLIGLVIPKLIVWSFLSLNWKYHDREAAWNKSKDTCLRLFKKCVVHTKFVIYVSLLLLGRKLCQWTISPRGYHSSSCQGFGTDIVYGIYIYRNVQFLNHVIIINTKNLPLRDRWHQTIFGYPVLNSLVF